MHGASTVQKRGKWVRFYFLVEVSSIKSGDFELEEQENWLVMCG